MGNGNSSDKGSSVDHYNTSLPKICYGPGTTRFFIGREGGAGYHDWYKLYCVAPSGNQSSFVSSSDTSGSSCTYTNRSTSSSYSSSTKATYGRDNSFTSSSRSSFPSTKKNFVDQDVFVTNRSRIEDRCWQMIQQASGDGDEIKVRSEVAKLLAESRLASGQVQSGLTHRFIHATTPEEFKATFKVVCQEITKPADDYEAIFKRNFEVMFGEGSYQTQLKPKIPQTTKSSDESATDRVQSLVKTKSTKGSSSMSNEYRSILFSRVDSTTLDQVESFPTKYIYNNDLAISSKQQQQLKSNPSWISAILSLPRDLLFEQVAYADEIPASSDDVSSSNSILQQEETWSVLHQARCGDPYAQLELRRRFPISAEASDVINAFYKAWNDPILGFKNYAHNRLGFSWFLPGSMDDLGEVCLNSAMTLVSVASIPKIAEGYNKVSSSKPRVTSQQEAKNQFIGSGLTTKTPLISTTLSNQSEQTTYRQANNLRWLEQLELFSDGLDHFTSQGEASNSWINNDFDLESMVYSSQSKMILNLYQQPKVGTRFMGAMQSGFGVGQLGLAVALAETGVGVAPACLLAARGADNLVAGGMTFVTGQDTSTMLHQTVRSVGLSDTGASWVEFGTDLSPAATSVIKGGILKLYDLRAARGYARNNFRISKDLNVSATNPSTSLNLTLNDNTTLSITQKGLGRIETHLDQILLHQNLPKELQIGERAMLERLRSGNRSLQDIEFYLHELKESAIFRQNGELSSAHKKALQWRSATERDLFHQSVIDANKEIFPVKWRENYEFNAYPPKPNI